MKIAVTIKEYEPETRLEPRYLWADPHWGLMMNGSDLISLKNTIKGALLFAVAGWDKVPDKIEFKFEVIKGEPGGTALL